MSRAAVRQLPRGRGLGGDNVHHAPADGAAAHTSRHSSTPHGSLRRAIPQQGGHRSFRRISAVSCGRSGAAVCVQCRAGRQGERLPRSGGVVRTANSAAHFPPPPPPRREGVPARAAQSLHAPEGERRVSTVVWGRERRGISIDVPDQSSGQRPPPPPPHCCCCCCGDSGEERERAHPQSHPPPPSQHNKLTSVPSLPPCLC